MAYDRYDARHGSRERWRSDEGYDRERGYSDRGRDRDDRGFFERAGDEIASWFGDEDAERRRRQESLRDRGDYGRDRNRDFSPRGNFRSSSWDRDSDVRRNWRDDDDERGFFTSSVFRRMVRARWLQLPHLVFMRWRK